MITSLNNPKIKSYAALKEKKYRDESRSFLIEGERLVLQAVASSAEINEIFVSAAAPKYIPKYPRAEILAEHVFAKLCDTETPQGVVAIVKKSDKPFNLPQKFSLILDGISDSGNLGAIIRTAAGLGYNDVYLYSCADPFSPKAVRASMGGIFSVNIYETGFTDLPKISAAATILGADMSGKLLDSITAEGNICIAIGSEAEGLSPEVRMLCEEFVSIPIVVVESLNAAVAAGIIMYKIKK